MNSLVAVPFPYSGQFPRLGTAFIDLNDPNLTIGDVITQLVPFIFVLAGLALLLYLVWGGIELMTSRGDPKGVESAKSKVTSALIGFIIIFVSYWLIQMLGTVFGIDAIKQIFQ